METPVLLFIATSAGDHPQLVGVASGQLVDGVADGAVAVARDDRRRPVQHWLESDRVTL